MPEPKRLGRARFTSYYLILEAASYSTHCFIFEKCADKVYTLGQQLSELQMWGDGDHRGPKWGVLKSEVIPSIPASQM